MPSSNKLDNVGGGGFSGRGSRGGYGSTTGAGGRARVSQKAKASKYTPKKTWTAEEAKQKKAKPLKLVTRKNAGTISKHSKDYLKFINKYAGPKQPKIRSHSELANLLKSNPGYAKMWKSHLKEDMVKYKVTPKNRGK